jgi:hypothetical protein
LVADVDAPDDVELDAERIRAPYARARRIGQKRTSVA